MYASDSLHLIINPEWGLAKNENPNQGAFIIDELANFGGRGGAKEFEAISERGGVLSAMETGYQRGKIQEESMYYEHKKHDGSYPIIGVNSLPPVHLCPARCTADITHVPRQPAPPPFAAKAPQRAAVRGCRSGPPRCG